MNPQLTGLTNHLLPQEKGKNKMKQSKKWKLNSGVKCYGTAKLGTSGHRRCMLAHKKQWGQPFGRAVDVPSVCVGNLGFRGSEPEHWGLLCEGNPSHLIIQKVLQNMSLLNIAIRKG